MLTIKSCLHVPSMSLFSVLFKNGSDPGFPVGRGADPLGGAPTYDFVKFSEKLHEIEKILGRRAPHKSATAIVSCSAVYM